MGSSKEVSKSVAKAVFPIGPGESIMLRQKTPRIAIKTHCPSLTDHRCDCSALIVSAGENEVCRAASELAGDWRLRSLLRNLRRSRWGTRSCNDFHGILTVVFCDDMLGCIAPQAPISICEAPSATKLMVRTKMSRLRGSVRIRIWMSREAPEILKRRMLWEVTIYWWTSTIQWEIGDRSEREDCYCEKIGRW